MQVELYLLSIIILFQNFISDRKKDLVKLQAGEYVSLSKVETVLKMSSLVEQICIYANSFHNFTVGLVVPNQKNLCKLASEIGLNGLDFKQLCQNQKLVKEVTKKLSDFGVTCKLFLSCFLILALCQTRLSLDSLFLLFRFVLCH